VFKKYNKSGYIAKNNQFKQQLYKNLTCDNNIQNKIKNSNYNKNDLIDIFKIYNTCNGGTFTSLQERKEEIKKMKYKISIKPRVNTFFFKTEYRGNFNYDFNFKSKSNLSFGFEAEIFLPFNNNKWSIAFEPNYKKIKNEHSEVVNRSSFTYYVKTQKIEYNIIEIPIILRHHFYTKKESSVFINSDISINIPLKKDFYETTTYRNSPIVGTIKYFDIQNPFNFGLGVGYNFRSKMSAEVRYQIPQNILQAINSFKASQSSVSLIFGYTLF
jgi:hypothetical protein